MRILLTGATGAIGSYLGPEFLKRGIEVFCLLRGEKPMERLLMVMSESACSQVKILTGDITLPLGGVSPDNIRQLRGQFDQAVHLAGSVAFDEDVAEETHAANVGGTRHMLALAEALDIRRFCYTSSSFALGESRNPYEKSKAEAEKLVRGWEHGEWQIQRPSIVVGDSRTGETNSWTGFYGYFSGFSWLKHNLWKLWRERGSFFCLQQGFAFDDDGNLVFEPKLLKIVYSLSSTLNLVPIDWLVGAMTDLIERGVANKAYDLANPSPSTLAWQFDVTFKMLGIRGIGQCDCLTGEAYFPSGSILREWQDNMYHRLGRYRPYVTHEDPAGCDALGGGPPDIDENFLGTMLKYAMATRFGHQQKEQVTAAL